MNDQYEIGRILSFKHIEQLLNANMAINATLGGLLIGRSHDQGHIYAAFKVAIGYEVRYQFEGYEYLFNAAAAIRYRQQFDILNILDRNITGAEFEEYIPSGDITIIDARLPCGLAKLLLFDYSDLHIYNKRATKCLLTTLNMMNNAVYPKAIHETQYEIELRNEEPIDVIFNGLFVDQIPGRY